MFKRRIRDAEPGPTTYVAPSTTITGNISGQGAYVFCGHVEGDCDIDGLVTLAEGGRWQGTLRANDVIIAGTVEGDVIGRRKVEVAGTARVAGTLAGSSIAVAVGAVIEGEIKVAGGGEHTQFEEKRNS
jgi:cytoskeletal protein CcmA (bactofilin family)